MRRYLAGLLLFSSPLLAWDATGHRVVAAIAYDHLNPKAKARVDELLKQHPDFAQMASRDAFLAAAVWPDTIKSDPRFYNDSKADAKPTPLLAGFPSMARHTDWHYVDIPFSPDGTPTELPKAPNALTELRRILKERKLTAYDLPWLLHIEGDVHQPLHCTSRFTKELPHGDQGGNLVYVTSAELARAAAAGGSGSGGGRARSATRNLHAVWDDAAGTNTSDTYVDRIATAVTAEVAPNGKAPKLSLDPKKWVDEGFELAKSDVYNFGSNSGTRETPVSLPEGYEEHVEKVAREQLARAGLRLAGVLNQKLGR